MTRGSGRTHRQLEGLPEGSLFVVENHGMVDHARMILRSIGKTGVRLVSRDHLGEDCYMIRGLTGRVEVDHACRLSGRQRLLIDAHNERWSRR